MSRTSAVHATSSSTTAANGSNKKLKGVRRRKWGKYVSEIRVPGTQERLWLGTYATAEAAAVAHDVAVYCLKRPSSLGKLNFPNTLSSYSSSIHNHGNLSPRSVQKVASDVAMDVDARNINAAAAKTPAATAEAEAAGACNVGGGDAADFGVYCWEGLGDDCGRNFHGSSDQNCGEGDQALSISIEDYL